MLVADIPSDMTGVKSGGIKIKQNLDKLVVFLSPVMESYLAGGDEAYNTNTNDTK